MNCFRFARGVSCHRAAQWGAVLAGATALKSHYSTASADDLRWILAPTTAVVEAVSGESFEFEKGSGYLSRPARFLIAPSCSGVNFLITAFVMLCWIWLRSAQSKQTQWLSIPAAAFAGYVTTIIANATRITIAMNLHQNPMRIPWFSPVQIHRLEGIIIYFGALMVLFAIARNIQRKPQSVDSMEDLVPLAIYYGISLLIPIVNSSISQPKFAEHALFVLIVPFVMMLMAFLARRLVSENTKQHSRN